MGRIFYKGEEVNELPADALIEMSKRLESVVSRYFASHPEEYERYLRHKKEKSAPAVPAT